MSQPSPTQTSPQVETTSLASGPQASASGDNYPSSGPPISGNGAPGDIWGKLPHGKFIPLSAIDRPADLLAIDARRVVPDEAAREAREKFVKHLEQKPGRIPTLEEVAKLARSKDRLDALVQATAELDREALDEVTRFLLSDEKVLAWTASEALKGGK